MADTNNEQTVGRDQLIMGEEKPRYRFEKRPWTLKNSFGMSVIIHLGVAIIFAFCATQSMPKKPEQEIVFVNLSQLLALPVAQQTIKSAAAVSVLPASTQHPPPALLAPVERQIPTQVVPKAQVAALPPVVPMDSPKKVVEQTRSESPTVAGAVQPSKTPSSAATAAVVDGKGITALATTAVAYSKGASAPEQVGDRTFGAASAPSFLHRTIPVYPAIARRFGKEGTVVLRLSIDEHGNLSGAEVLQDPGYGFAAAAVEAVKKSRFNPAHNKGKPVSAKAILPVRFAFQGA